MENDLIKIYEDELKFLLKLKDAVGPLNNRLHDTLAAVAIEKLQVRFPEYVFKYGGAGLPGLDIQAFNKDGKKILVAEIKTTSGEELRGPQGNAIKKDLERLKQDSEAMYKILILLSSDIKEKVQIRFKVQENYPGIEIFNAFEGAV